MAVALETLSEEEAYLWAILTDVSGLDLAEFTWYEASDLETDTCWRAYDYQWDWFRCKDALQIDQCARSVGKSLSIKLRAYAFPFLWPGQEMVITAPELNHLEAIVELIEGKFYDTRLGREMLITKRGGVTHRPFSMKFENGARIMGRIPQKDGKGVKGIHPMWLELDEAQDYPEKGWVELQQTLKRGVAGAVWRAHGVTKGVRDYFYKFTTDPKSRWKVHKLSGMHRPSWDDDERQEAMDFYGSKDNPDYRRNILGEHGDATNPLFVLTALMRCVDDNQASFYNEEEYFVLKMNPELVDDFGGDILPLIELPSAHLAKYKTFWIGMDVGFTRDPSEILIFAEYELKGAELTEARKHQPDPNDTTRKIRKAVPRDGATRLKLVGRIQLRRITSPAQAKVVKKVIDHYKPRAFAMDATGNGLPLFQDIQESMPEYVDYIKGYKFNSKILVDFDQRIAVDEFKGDLQKESGIERQVLEYSTDKLRELVDHERLWLPWDMEVIGEFQGQTYTIERSTMDEYGRKRFSDGSFHTLDAARMAVLGWKQYAIEELTSKKRKEDVIDIPFYGD
jgi:hypothetical protein